MENFTHLYPTSSGLDIRLKLCGYEECVSRHSFGPAYREYFLIHCVIQGSGWYQVRGKTYQIKAGQFFTVFPDDCVVYRADEQNPWKYCWTGFVGGDAEPYLRGIGITPETPIGFVTDTEKVMQIVCNMYAAARTGEKGKAEAIGWLYIFLSILSGNPSIALLSNDIFSLSNLYYQKAKNYIDDHHAENISVQDVCSYLSISRSYLSRLFQTYGLHTPQQCILNARLTTACYLLKRTNMSVQEIAFKAGFNSFSRFCYCFRRAFEVTPTQYRKNNAEYIGVKSETELPDDLVHDYSAVLQDTAKLQLEHQHSDGNLSPQSTR